MPVVFHPNSRHPKAAGGKAYAAIITAVHGGPPDYDLRLACIDSEDGSIFTVSRPLFLASWHASGQSETVDYWAFIDLS
jgi:hypothetical protein